MVVGITGAAQFLQLLVAFARAWILSGWHLDARCVAALYWNHCRRHLFLTSHVASAQVTLFASTHESPSKSQCNRHGRSCDMASWRTHRDLCHLLVAFESCRTAFEASCVFVCTASQLQSCSSNFPVHLTKRKASKRRAKDEQQVLSSWTEIVGRSLWRQFHRAIPKLTKLPL
jgi:hypothetical protein